MKPKYIFLIAFLCGIAVSVLSIAMLLFGAKRAAQTPGHQAVIGEQALNASLGAWIRTESPKRGPLYQVALRSYLFPGDGRRTRTELVRLFGAPDESKMIEGKEHLLFRIKLPDRDVDFTIGLDVNQNVDPGGIVEIEEVH